MFGFSCSNQSVGPTRAENQITLRITSPALDFEPDPDQATTVSTFICAIRILETDLTLNLDDMTSSLAQLQNYAPADETRTMIRKMIQEKEACLEANISMLKHARVQREIASKAVECLRDQLAEAERAEIVAIYSFEAANKAVSDITAAISEHKALIHPIRSLPFEILYQIFEHCISDDDHAGRMQVAIRLSSVCRTWRLVAHSLGSLWSHIDYALWDPSVAVIFEHFRDHSSYYLNIHVDPELERNSVYPAPFSLADFPFNRIQSLTIQIPSGDLHDQLWPTVLHNLSRLEVYKVYDSEPAPILQGDLLRHCRNLKELELGHVGISFNEAFVLPELSQISLTEICDSPFTPLSLKHLFERAPHLKSLSFIGPDFLDTEDGSPTVYDFQPLCELTFLQIQFPSSGHLMAPFLKDLSLLPTIQHLSIGLIDEYAMNGFGDLFAQCDEMVSLTKLTLEVDLWTYTDVHDPQQRLRALRYLRSLETLEVWGRAMDYATYFTTCLCEVLSECTADPLLPALRIIRFRGKAKPEAPVGAIIRMVEARMRAAKVSPQRLVPLESVTLEDCESFGIDEYRRLKRALGHSS